MNYPSRLLSKLKEAALTEEKQETLVYKTSSDKRLPNFFQLQYLPRLLGTREKWLFWLAVVVIVAGLPFTGIRWYYRSTDIVPDFGGSYTEGLVGTPQYVNPILSPLSDVDSDLTKLIFSGIFRYNDKQELEPDLITNYVVSDDQLTYSFFLRHDVEWHDGEAFDADDVLFTVAAIQDQSYQSPLYSSLKGVVAKKLDEYSFSLTLPEPFAPFLTALTFGVLPEHIWFNVPAQNVRLTELNIKPIGTGPYQFDELAKDKAGNIKSFTVIRNESYYSDKPYLDSLSFIFYSTIAAAVDALETKKVEGVSFIPVDTKEAIQKKNAEVVFHSLRIPQYIAIFFNQKKSAVLQNSVVRQALARTVNREEIIDQVFGGDGEEIFTAILPGYVGHNAEVEKYDFNIEEAIRTLEEDGWVYPDPVEDTAEETAGAETEEGSEAGEIVVESEAADPLLNFIPREKDGVKLEFTISTVDLPAYQQTLAIMQEHWKEIGMKVNVDTYSPEDITGAIIKSRDYEALFFGEIVGTDPDPFPFWHSSQQEHPGLALSIFRDNEVDQLLEEARKTTDDEVRRLKYLHFQNNIAEEVPAIFLYNPLYTYAVHSKIQGVNDKQYITVPSDRFSGTHYWYVETKREFRQ